MQRIVKILADTYGTTVDQAPREAVQWAYERIYGTVGRSVADTELESFNRARKALGKAPVYRVGSFGDVPIL